jgi:hypothetical protein
MFGVNIQPLGLKKRPLVPIDAHPLQGLQDGIRRFLGGPDGIRVLDSQDKLALHMPGIQPVEKSRPGTAEMKVARRAGGKPGNYFFHLYDPFDTFQPAYESLYAASESKIYSYVFKKLNRFMPHNKQCGSKACFYCP